METSLKNGFALLLLPKKSESPKIWGGGLCPPISPPNQYAYGNHALEHNDANTSMLV